MPRSTAYRVDADNRIRYLSPGWLDFAKENGAPELAPNAVLGRPLGDFVAGVDIWHLYQMLFERVRSTGKTVTVPFRCDSPEKRRFMEMSIASLTGGALEIETFLVKEDPRQWVPFAESAARPSDERLIVCSWCKRVASPEGQWLELEDAARSMELSTAPRRWTHGVCERCRARIVEEFEEDVDLGPG